MKKLSVVILMIIAVFTTRCTTEPISDQNQQNQSVSQETIRKLEEAGYDVHTYPVRPKKGGVVVDNDIFLSNDYISTLNGKQRVWSVVSCANANEINIRVQVTNKTIRKAIKNAMKAWNSIDNVHLKFIQDKSKPTDVAVVPASLAPQIYAEADFPNGGTPGRKIEVNLNNADISIAFPNETKFTQKYWNNLMIHELGHIAGLAHTNTEDRYFIPGTNSEDKESIMVKEAETFLKLPGLSAGDKKAIRILYKTNTNNLGQYHCSK